MLDTRQLGKSGLSVSRLCLGTMNFGEPGRGPQGGLDAAHRRGGPSSRPPWTSGTSSSTVGTFTAWGRRAAPARARAGGPTCALDGDLGGDGPAPQSGRPVAQACHGGRRCVPAALRSRLCRPADHPQPIVHRHPHGRPRLPRRLMAEKMAALHEVVKAGKATAHFPRMECRISC